MVTTLLPGKHLCRWFMTAASVVWVCLPVTVNGTGNGESPSIKAGVPFFYYQDLPQAVDWYEHKLGLRKIVDKGWVAIFALNSASQIGLVNATDGSLSPTTEKGALLSIETDDLEAWYNRLKGVEGVNMIHGIEIGAKGMIEEFRMRDPGGYIVEFFRWRDGEGPEASGPVQDAGDQEDIYGVWRTTEYRIAGKEVQLNGLMIIEPGFLIANTTFDSNGDGILEANANSGPMVIDDGRIKLLQWMQLHWRPTQPAENFLRENVAEEIPYEIKGDRLIFNFPSGNSYTSERIR